MSPSEDYDDRGPSFPRSVRVAGVIWIIFGSIGLLLALLSILACIRVMAGPIARGGNPAAGVCAACVEGVIAIAFLSVGIRSIRGRAKDTLENGAGSIALSLLSFGLILAVAY